MQGQRDWHLKTQGQTIERRVWLPNQTEIVECQSAEDDRDSRNRLVVRSHRQRSLRVAQDAKITQAGVGGGSWAWQNTGARAEGVKSQTAANADWVKVQWIHGAVEARTAKQYCRSAGRIQLEQGLDQQSARLAAKQTRYVQTRAGHT